MSERPEPNERVGMQDSPYLHDKSEEVQFRKCNEPTVWRKNLLDFKVMGYVNSEVVEMIQKLRKKGFSKDSKVLREEAIRRCQRMF